MPATNTKAYEGRFLEIACDGFAPGVSGGPFLRNFDGKRGEGIGVIGGYKTGASTSQNCVSAWCNEKVWTTVGTTR
ncbi:hypothetical protein [Streptomyces lasiicapitis]|uniref:hypothetical protein n=1 Tax=Streptomyces lasiicapitis TaxID=1923961 RepID=UPI0036516DA2